MDESAVTEVIGVILIVALTVILAAIIAAYAFGMVGNISSNYNVIVTVDKTDLTHFNLTYRGGSDHAKLTQLKITWPDGAQETDDTPVVGEAFGPFTITPSTRDHYVVVVAHFSEGKEQVILNTYV
jgi:FlaG/FlaF family flagellin (archaellin)